MSLSLIRRCYPVTANAFTHVLRRCNVSTVAAKTALGFSGDDKPTLRELRHAYFEAAKRYHPDVVRQHDDASVEGSESSRPLDFRDITEAYEHLLSGDHVRYHNKDEEIENMVSIREEREYREACQSVLGLPAEIVEESKRNPMFRQWLDGNTDAAHHWRAFFAVHGGLAQKLRRPAGYLGGGDDGIVRKSEKRRKRPRK